MYMYFFDSSADHINDLNKNMKNNKKINNLTVIFFLAPWCKYCNELKPVINTIESELDKSGLNGIMAKVYDDKINNLRPKKKISSFPTISVFNKKGKYEDYKGSRDREDLTRFLISVFEKNKNRFDKKKKSKKLLRRLSGLTKGKKILKRISSRIKKPRIHPWKKFSNVYKTVKKKLKKRKKRHKYQTGGRTKKRKKKIICKNPNKKKNTRKQREKVCFENKKCVFSNQMESKGYDAPCYPKKNYWKDLGLNWNKVMNRKASKN